MIGELPYDGTASNLVTGLDTLVKIFDIAKDRRNIITTDIIPQGVSSDQTTYFQEVIERVKLSQELTRKYLETFDAQNRHAVQRALTHIYKKANYDTVVPRVKSIVDMGYCLGFVESNHSANSQMHLGEVDSMTLYRTLLLPHEVEAFIQSETKPLYGILKHEIKAKEKQLRAETTFPLIFTTKDLDVQLKNASQDLRFLEMLFGNKPGQTTFNETNVHEARHLQDVILCTAKLRVPNIPSFIETQAHLYTDSSFEGFNRDVEAFKKYHFTCKKTAEERIKTYTTHNLTEFQKSEIEYLKNINERLQKGFGFFKTVVNSINEQKKNPAFSKISRQNKKAISYIFSTTLPTHVSERFRLACEEYIQTKEITQK